MKETGSFGASWWAVCAATVFTLVAAGARGADDATAAERLERGLALAARGRCEEALEALASIPPENPAHTTAALADAQCLIRLQRHAEAVQLLRRLRERAPPLPEIDLYLAIAAYHTGDLDTAQRALDRASPQLSSRAETHLYRGILALEQDRFEAAIASFEHARELDAARADPMASYYAGVSHARLGRDERAREELRRVVATGSDRSWSERAQLLLNRLDRRSASRARRWQLRATLGIESDDNVVLRGDDITLPENISDESDERLMWLLRGDADLLRGEAGKLGFTTEYTGTSHRELDTYDVHYPGAALWWLRTLGENDVLRAEYRFGYAWVDGDPYVVTHSFGPTLLHKWATAGRTSTRLRGFAYSYLDEPNDIPDGVGAPGDMCPGGAVVCGAPGIDESERRARTGIGYEVLVGHRIRLPSWDRSVELRPAFRFQHYFAQGAESDYLRIEPSLGARVVLPFGVFANTALSYTYRPFLGASSLPDASTLVAGEQFAPTWRRRRDHAWRASAGFERTLFELFKAEVRYSFLDNDSNQPSADYDRHIIGCYLTVQLGSGEAHR